MTVFGIGLFSAAAAPAEESHVQVSHKGSEVLLERRQYQHHFKECGDAMLKMENNAMYCSDGSTPVGLPDIPCKDTKRIYTYHYGCISRAHSMLYQAPKNIAY
ncbi:uncharacterized protein B0P05DRAFT_590328 [Gilbertella persicaria]|uniref:uncharacterized protein n=1 Tax=Gilbertella persicaria TaxID=101096 RepID=UPI00221F443F|nr:uncharacterized protein B0P05DRAFT_590328 [Gilbertella persicaria]KAI8063393.1 hypothetical protein B0P05DRAFT_590328 [Gilbertella persicaria]